MSVEFLQDVLRHCRTDSTEAIGAGRGERLSKCTNDFGEDWMRTDSDGNCLQARRHNFRNNLSFRQNHGEWAGPEFFSELENQLSILRWKRGNSFQPIMIGKMNDERVETRTSLCFENFGDRDWVQRIGGKSVNSFRRQRDRFAVAQQFNRRVAVG